ncbi:MAG: rhomboid family intramembrane serine protease [Vicinamibacterales bacterium]
MRRYQTASTYGYTFGPGPLTPAIRAIVITNVVVFVIMALDPTVRFALEAGFGMQPSAAIGQFRLWQFVTYMFLHAGFFHILFNMLTLWMFGVELERMWGSAFFTKFYLVTGVGAAATQVLLSFTPLAVADRLYESVTIGASGAIYGVLLAYAVYFPHRIIHYMMLFPIPAKYFVAIMGAIALISSVNASGGGIAHGAHLGGMIAAWLYLKSRVPGRLKVMAEIKYRYLKWRIAKERKRFDVYQGGRADDSTRRPH